MGAYRGSLASDLQIGSFQKTNSYAIQSSMIEEAELFAIQNSAKSLSILFMQIFNTCLLNGSEWRPVIVQ